MPTAAVDRHAGDDERDLIHRAVQALVEGRLVAFPTETVYGVAAHALDEAAVARLVQIKGRPAGKPVALAIRGVEQALDYCPAMSVVARRLGSRCWPGPLTLVLDATHPDSLLQRLPDGVQQIVSPSGLVGLRVPDHRYILSALDLVPGPLVLSSANRSGQADAVSAPEVVDALGRDVDLVLDDGPSKYAQPSSVVRVTGNHVELARQGIVSETQVRRFASLVVVVVCTGNTCRSPMAEVLLKKLLADRLECGLGDLEDRGVMVQSAGIAAATGGPAAANAIEAVRQRNLDLSQHASQPVSDVLVRFADQIITMTQGHREALVAHWPEAADKTVPVRSDGYDVADPIGGSLDEYLQCADELETHLRQWVDQLADEQLPVF
jgi:protein-tyrosine phosphatase